LLYLANKRDDGTLKIDLHQIIPPFLLISWIEGGRWFGCAIPYCVMYTDDLRQTFYVHFDKTWRIGIGSIFQLFNFNWGRFV
jgi:hypothetical protein